MKHGTNFFLLLVSAVILFTTTPGRAGNWSINGSRYRTFTQNGSMWIEVDKSTTGTITLNLAKYGDSTITISSSTARITDSSNAGFFLVNFSTRSNDTSHATIVMTD